MEPGAASQRLGYVRASKLGVISGYVQLDDKGLIPKAVLPAKVEPGYNVCIGMTNTAVPGVANLYQITNYHSYSEYAVRCDVGQVTISQDMITYIPLNRHGNAGFYVNDEFFTVIVGEGGPLQPKIISPVNQGKDVGSSVILTSSTFSSSNQLDSHFASQWQISLDPDFTSIYFDSYYDTTNKTSVTVTDLKPSKVYYSRVRYKGIEEGVSPWSATVMFNTAQRFIATNEQAKLADWNAKDSDYFGSAVAISGDGNTVIVGAPQNDLYAVQAGQCFVFTRSGVTWTLQARLHAQDFKAGDFFGASVAISRDGDVVMVGASGKGLVRGSVYIFRRIGVIWNQSAKILAEDGYVGDYFGSSISMAYDGSCVVIGSMYQNNKCGAAYVYNRMGNLWSQLAKLESDQTVQGDFFGSSVAIASGGKVILVGAMASGTVADRAGAVYAFTRTGTAWALETVLKGTRLAPGDMFGYSLSLSATGSVAVIGAYSADSQSHQDAGMVYVYLRDATLKRWSEHMVLLPNDSADFDYFGSCVFMSPDASTFIVGAFNKDKGKGCAYIYGKKDVDWLQINRLQSVETKAVDFFGFSVGLCEDGSTAVVGSYRVDAAEIDTGAAYIFG